MKDSEILAHEILDFIYSKDKSEAEIVEGIVPLIEKEFNAKLIQGKLRALYEIEFKINKLKEN